MSVFIQCPQCGKTSRKDEGTGRLGEFSFQTLPPQCTVVQRQCPTCAACNRAGLASPQLAAR